MEKGISKAIWKNQKKLIRDVLMITPHKCKKPMDKDQKMSISNGAPDNNVTDNVK